MFTISLIAGKMIFAQKSLDFILKPYTSKEIPFITVDSLHSHVKDFYILDARELNEFNVSHIKNALFTGYESFSEQNVKEMLPDQEKPIAVYCSLGVRSFKIAERLKKMGYQNIYNVYGGIFEWKNRGYEVIDNKGKETENVHAYSRLWGFYLKKGVKVYE